MHIDAPWLVWDVEPGLDGDDVAGHQLLVVVHQGGVVGVQSQPVAHGVPVELTAEGDEGRQTSATVEGGRERVQALGNMDSHGVWWNGRLVVISMGKGAKTPEAWSCAAVESVAWQAKVAECSTPLWHYVLPLLTHGWSVCSQTSPGA